MLCACIQVPAISFDCFVIGVKPGITEMHLVKIGLNPSMPLPKFACTNDLEPCLECEKQSQALERRRRKEASELAALDTTEIAPGQHWYMLSQNWLSQWLKFRSGGDVPGPIDNSDLLLPSLQDSSPRPRPGLVRGQHYRGMNEAVWTYLFRAYGGGPAIPRLSINIYDNPPDGHSQ